MNRKAIRRFELAWLAYFALVGWCRAEKLEVDDAMYQDPGFQKIPVVLNYKPELKDGWLKALRRPEPELKRLAADTIVVARQLGMSNLEDTAEDLLAVLEANAEEQSVQRALAHALVELDARQAAGLLFERNQQSSIGFSQVVEPALGRWEHQPMVAVWRERLEQPSVGRTRLMLAIEGLGAAGDEQGSEALQKLVADQRGTGAVRLAAAGALARIHTEGLVELAQELASVEGRSALVNQLLAATLLNKHKGSDAIALLQQLAAEAEPVVVARAMERLFEIDPKLVFDLAPPAVKSSDVKVRAIGSRALLVKADDAAVQLLGPLLDDHNPSLRQSVASGLFELGSQDELNEPVIAQVTEMLSGQSWRGLEQALLLVGSLDHKASAPRCIELLASERDEVAVTAAWALRRLKIPETLPDLLARAKLVKRMFDGVVKPPEFPSADALSGQLSQLMQSFGEMRYMEADPLLKLMVPKKFIYGGEEQLTPDPRAAAIWSLGYLHEGQAPEELGKQLASRLNDQNILVPEFVNVRRQSAVSLGRMQSKAQLKDLRGLAGNDYIGQACFWAIERITGEPSPPPIPLEIDQSNWFISPLATE